MEDDEVPIAVEIDEISSVMTNLSTCRRDDDSVGVTVITGYLGAGKSTLVNYILNRNHGRRIAVIVNEFGDEVGVERAMINDGDNETIVEEWIELNNGCICCTVKHSLVQALEQLVQRNERLDHILLETTGLADPAPLASILWLDDQLESAVRLDCIITVIDAKNLRLHLSQSDGSPTFSEVFLQIVFADVIILNKIDLADKDAHLHVMDIEDMEKELMNINPLADVIRSVRCQVDLSNILECHAYDAKHFAHLDTLLKDHRSASMMGVHNTAMQTFSLSVQRPVDLVKLRLWFEEILWEKKYVNIDVYRIKGVLNIENSDELHIVQAVEEIYEIVPARQWLQREAPVTKIVFIGRILDETILYKSFQATVGADTSRE